MKALITLLFLLQGTLCFAQPNLTFTNGDSTGVIKFPATGCLYQWTNNNPAIGLVKTGSGDIGSFKAINLGRVPITATITTNPVYEYAYICNSLSNSVSVINTVTATVIATLNVGDYPTGNIISADAAYVYIVHGASSKIEVISTATNTVTAVIDAGSFVQNLAVSPVGNRLYASGSTTNLITIINTATNTVIKTISQENPTNMVTSHDGSKLYVMDDITGVATIYNTVDFSVVGHIDFVGGTNTPGHITFIRDLIVTPDDKLLYANTFGNGYNGAAVFIADLVKNILSGQILIDPYPGGMSLASDGTTLYIPQQFLNTIAVLNVAQKKFITSIPVINQPANSALNSNESRLYVTNFQGKSVTVINTATNKALYTIPVGFGPGAGPNFIADLPGCALPNTFTITVNPSPRAIVTKGIPDSLTTTYGTPSRPGSFLLSATNLGEGISVMAAGGFEISTDSVNYKPSLYVGAAGDLQPTKIFVRISARAVVGKYTGVINLNSAEAADKTVIVTGTVTPADLIIKADHEAKLYGDPNPLLTTTYIGLKNGDTGAQFTSPPNISTTADTFSAIGTYPITVSGALAANYSILYLQNTLEIVTGLQIPNTFTPNSDGINDLWSLKYLELYPKASVKIFNRYGDVIFFAQTNFSYWDGTFNGTPVPQGTYYYIIDPRQGTKPIAGWVTVIR